MKVGHCEKKEVESPQFAMEALTSVFCSDKQLFGHGEAETGREIRDTIQDALEPWETRGQGRAGALAVSQWI